MGPTLKLFSLLQVLYKVYISFVEVGVENVQTADYFKGVGESTERNTIKNTSSVITSLFLFLCSLLPHRQYRGDSGGSGVRRHPWLHHSFHQEGPDHRAALRLPAGLPGLPDRRALLLVRHSVVSLKSWCDQGDHYDQCPVSLEEVVPQCVSFSPRHIFNPLDWQ